MNRAYLGFLFVGASFVLGCLPGDTRPDPGRVVVTAEASASSVYGFTTHDGWTIRFDKLLVGLGNVELADVQLATERCNAYAQADYDRLFNFTVAGTQKLGEVYGLGACEVTFRLRPPSSESLLQNGVIAADRDFMREWIVAGDPMQLPTDDPPPQTAIYMRGTATNGSQTKRFDWKFAARDSLASCLGFHRITPTTSLDLIGGDDLHSVISFHGEDLFRLRIENPFTYKFGVFADADIDADDEITNDELNKKIIFTGNADASESGLGEFLGQSVFPQMVYFDGDPCQRIGYQPGFDW